MVAAASFLEASSVWAIGLLRAPSLRTRVWEGFLVEEAIGNGEVGHSRQQGSVGHS